MASEQSARRSPSVDMGVPDALVDAPDPGQANSSSVSRSPEGAVDRLPGGEARRDRFTFARILKRSAARDRVAELLDVAGVRIDGDAASDMRVHDERLYARIIAHGSLGLGEGYMDGWWDAEDLDGLLYRILSARLDERVGGIDDAALFVQSKLINLQNGLR